MGEKLCGPFADRYIDGPRLRFPNFARRESPRANSFMKWCARVYVRTSSTRHDWEICGEGVNGQEAIKLAEELRPDAIIMDITMPVD